MPKSTPPLPPAEIVSLASFYLADFPEGIYHRHLDKPGAMYRNGAPFLELRDAGRVDGVPCTDDLVAALVLMLNARP